MSLSMRKVNRDILLKGVYDYYFENSGHSQIIAIRPGQEEAQLAYEYLAGKNYITWEDYGPSSADARQYEAKILAAGIDYIEEIYADSIY